MYVSYWFPIYLFDLFGSAYSHSIATYMHTSSVRYTHTCILCTRMHTSEQGKKLYLFTWKKNKPFSYHSLSLSCAFLFSFIPLVSVLFFSSDFYHTRVCIASKCLWFIVKAVFTVKHHQNSSAQKFRVIFCDPICYEFKFSFLWCCRCGCSTIFFFRFGNQLSLLLLYLVRCSVN